MNKLSGKMLALITARGGSKGLPRKNVLPLAGKPLIAWSVIAALDAQSVNRVVVSTDDPEIAHAALAAGAEVPFIRPASLATDTATSVDVIFHALSECPGYDYFVLLQPTSPLRTTNDIDKACQLLKNTNSFSCVSICEANESPWNMFLTAKDGQIKRLVDNANLGSRRQDYPKVYRLNGAIYIAQTEWFLAEGKLIGERTCGFVMPNERSIDIDDVQDFMKAEKFLSLQSLKLT
jgi:CMP-N,N'-diacetyllegionaminic acid synthase